MEAISPFGGAVRVIDDPAGGWFALPAQPTSLRPSNSTPQRAGTRSARAPAPPNSGRWAFEAFCASLVGNHVRPVGLGCGAGPEAGSRGRSRTKHGAQRIISGGGQSACCAAQSGRIGAERGRYSSAGASSSIRQPDFHHSKESIRQGTPRGEFEGVERVRSLRALQDGRIEAPARSPSAQRLAGQTGSEGCLFRGANPPRFQETALISMVRSAVPISVLAFRPEQRAKGVHQAHEGSDVNSAQPRCAPDYPSEGPADYCNRFTVTTNTRNRIHLSPAIITLLLLGVMSIIACSCISECIMARIIAYSKNDY